METRTLYSWWSRTRRDTLTTTDPSWEEGDSGPPRNGYVLHRTEGRVIDPDTSPQPLGTAPLMRWSSVSRRDHATTSHPSWRDPSVIEAPDYRFVRREGFVFDHAYAGTAALYGVWDATIDDNATTTHLRWDDHLLRPRVRVAGSTGGGTRTGTPLGFVLPLYGDLPVEAPDDFGYGQFRRAGRRAVLVIVVDFVDAKVSTPLSYWRSLFAGPDWPNVGDYFAEMSAGQLRLDPVHVTRVELRQTRAAAQADVLTYDNAVFNAVVSQAGVNLQRYDLDGDGTVSDGDLTVFFITAGGSGGSTRVRTTTIAGTRLELAHICACDEFGDVRLYGHELTHALSFDEHSYGPQAMLNRRVTLYAGNTSRTDPGAGPVHLDPWNKILLGWSKPRVLRIGTTCGSGFVPAVYQVTADHGAGAPLLFYDPVRGVDEFFVVEYRGPDPDTGYDANVIDRGVAIWYVRRNAPGTAGGPPHLDPGLGSRRDGLAATLNWPMSPGARPTDPPTPITGGRPRLTNPRPTGGNMLANFLIGPTGLAIGPFWKPSDGVISLAWPIDRVDSGLRLRVGPIEEGSSSVAVQWWHATQPFLPRLDDCVPMRLTAGRTTSLTIEGSFPVDGVLHIVLTPMPTGSPKSVGQVSEIAGQIRRLTARIDAPEERGSYHVQVRLADGSTSNSCPVDVV